MLIDLHMHTRRSDGIWSVERLLEEVRARRLDVFSTSDHDTLDAYPLRFDVPATCIPAFEGGIAKKESPLPLALTAQRIARSARMTAMIESVRTYGVDVTMEHVRAQTGDGASLGRPHLARALVAIGAVTTVQEAFLIRESGGVSIELLNLGVDGIEIVHPTVNTDVQAQRTAKARERHLLVTGGTDFYAPLPEHSTGVEFAREDVEQLLHAIALRAQ